MMTRRRTSAWVTGAVALGALLYLSFSCCLWDRTPAPPLTPVATSRDDALALRKRLMAVKARRGPFTVTVGDAELTSYVVYLMQLGAGEFPARDVCVRFSRAPGSSTGYVEVWATFIDVAPADIPVYVRSTVEAVDGRVVFRIVQANAGPCVVPGMVRETVAQVLSESLAELDLEVQVESVEVTQGEMVVSGRVTGHVPDLP